MINENSYSWMAQRQRSVAPPSPLFTPRLQRLPWGARLGRGLVFDNDIACTGSAVDGKSRHPIGKRKSKWGSIRGAGEGMKKRTERCGSRKEEQRSQPELTGKEDSYRDLSLQWLQPCDDMSGLGPSFDEDGIDPRGTHISGLNSTPIFARPRVRSRNS